MPQIQGHSPMIGQSKTKACACQVGQPILKILTRSITRLRRVRFYSFLHHHEDSTIQYKCFTNLECQQRRHIRRVSGLDPEVRNSCPNCWCERKTEGMCRTNKLFRLKHTIFRQNFSEDGNLILGSSVLGYLRLMMQGLAIPLYRHKSMIPNTGE